MNQVEAVNLLIQAAQLAQSKGVFSFKEAALLSGALDVLTTPVEPTEPTESNADNVEPIKTKEKKKKNV